MKHIIPTLTLTALAAAASAQQAAAPAGLNYNQITLSRTSRDNTLGAQMALGQSNLVLGIVMSNDRSRDSEPALSAGYVFKGVTQGIDATVFVSQAQWEETVYGLTLRRALNEIYQGLEISASYATTGSGSARSYINLGGAVNWGDEARSVELSYNVNKTFAVAVGFVEIGENETDTVVSVRAGF